ncbi:MAG TPA: hypothetical protein VKZ63_12555 [Kofleriaceae bacterium]|nr:hypothetical protein [Kofleriaceae bacterium]
MAASTTTPIGELLRGTQGELVSRAVEAFRASPLRMPSPVDAPGAARLLAPILEALGDALSAPVKLPDRAAPPLEVSPVLVLVPGSTACREVEKAAALVGAILAAESTTGFDLAALFFSLRTVLGELPVAAEDQEALAGFAEWLAVVAFDAFAAARAQAEREKAREQLEEGTPVVLVTPELPAAFLIGRPDGVLVDSVLSRLLLMVVRVGARAVLLHAGGLTDPDRPEVIAALSRFLRHRKVAGAVHVISVGLLPEAEPSWRALADDIGTRLTFESHFDGAVERGLGESGYRLVRS